MWDSIFRTSKNKQFSYVVFDTIKEVDTVVWDSLNFSNAIYLCSDYLKSFEKGMRDSISFKYLIFYNQEKIAVAISVLQIVGFKPGELLQEKIPCSISDKVKVLFLENKKLNLLICGNLFACGENGFSHSDAISREETLEIVSDAISELYKEKKGETKISFALFKEFWPASFVLSKQLKEDHFKEFCIDVNMVLELNSEWKDFDSYLGAMNTKYRTRAKNVLKKSKKINKVNFSSAMIQSHLPQIKRLYVEVLARVDYNLGILDAVTFQYLKEELEDRFVFTGYFLEDTLIGFSTAFIFNNLVDANFIGIDYEFVKEYKLYQRMLYDYVDLAIEHKSTELRLGRTAETIKSGVGAKPVSMKLYTRHRNCLSTKLMQPIITSITPNTYEIRNPFKN